MQDTAVVTINRPQRRNALDGDAWRGAAFTRLDADRDVRAIVICEESDGEKTLVPPGQGA